MTRTRISSLLLIGLLSVVGLSSTSTAQPKPRYRLIDLGTFGGPNSSVGGQSVVVTNTRSVAGGADTSIPDPYAPECFNRRCFVEHAFLAHSGTLTDLGALPGSYSSFGYAINEQDLVVGWSQNGIIDPLTGVPEYVPTAWRKGKVIEIGTFGGAFGQASALNDNGFVVGAAENTTAGIVHYDERIVGEVLRINSRAPCHDCSIFRYESENRSRGIDVGLEGEA